MANVIALKIDVKKIDKARLFTSEKTGAVYLDAVLMLNLEKNQYDQNGPIYESISKEERESGIKGTILGNAKILSWDAPKPEPAVTDAKIIDKFDGDVIDKPTDADGDELPF